MDPGHYILKGKEIVSVDLLTWAQWFENIKNRQIGSDHVGDIFVSTVFLGIDHGWGTGVAPILFETMIFGGKHDQYQERCATYDEAVKMHQKALKLVQKEGEAVLTLQQLKEMEPDTIFATGLTTDDPDGLNLTNSGKTLRWVACRGGIWDWAIYAQDESWPEDEVKRLGDKVHNRETVKKLVPCDDEALEMYRD